MFESQFETYVPGPPSTVHHIIWNLLVTDKLTTLTPELITENKVKHIIAILPDKEEYTKLSTQIPDVSFDVMEYGNVHEMGFDQELYDNYAKKIDQIAKTTGTRNVLVFCNNGYQRSVPFLVYYLTNYHRDEVPNIEKAVELILSQLDRENFSKIKEETIKNMNAILQIKS
jgi:protein-tyrosine phosphatase